MHRLKLTFPYTGQHVRSIDWTLLCIGLITLLWVFFQFRQATEAANYWSIRVERLEQQQPQATSRSRSTSRNREISQEIGRQLLKANTILDQINLPWGALFDSIEHIAGEDVALLSLQPNVANRTLRINGEARNIDVLLDFIEAMEREVIFEKAHLVNYKIKQDSPHRPINFLITTVWIVLS